MKSSVASFVILTLAIAASLSQISCNTSVVRVGKVLRARAFEFEGSGLVAATDPVNEVLTVISLKGISADAFDNQEDVHLIVAGDGLDPVFSVARAALLEPMIIAAFSTPVSVTEGRLVVGEVATVTIEAPVEIRGKVSQEDFY